MKTKILITGANSQLARCIRDLDFNFPDFEFIYRKSSELDITNSNQIINAFYEGDFDWCINCAAYTAVDKAETDRIKAYEVNVDGVENLAKTCRDFNSKLIHISTDFVFNGELKKPYTETHETNSLSVYGASKLEGEKKTQTYLDHFFIIRTSWLYSEYGNNFLKTMLRLSKDRDELGVVADQIGTPTNAMDLAAIILKIIQENNTDYGIYNYSNEGIASWYDFAVAIFELKSVDIKVKPITTEDFPTPAKRPSYSVLDKTKIKNVFKVEIPHWKNSLKKTILNL